MAEEVDVAESEEEVVIDGVSVPLSVVEDSEVEDAFSGSVVGNGISDC